MTPHDPARDQPLQRPAGWCSTAAARRWWSIRRRCRFAQDEMDRIYGLPFTRQPHPGYGRQRIPAFEVSQGLGPDHARLLRRLHVLLDHGPPGQDHPEPQPAVGAGRDRPLADDPDFKGVISDIGGPTANMYRHALQLGRKCAASCRRPSCVHPTICKLLDTDHGPLMELMRAARQQPGIKKVLVASGIRMDLAQREPGVHPRAGRASRGRAAEGRARACRPARCCG